MKQFDLRPVCRKYFRRSSDMLEDVDVSDGSEGCYGCVHVFSSDRLTKARDSMGKHQKYCSGLLKSVSL